jgi:hypothetical protein
MEFNKLQIPLCNSFGVAARMISPEVQGIVVTRDMALAFWMYSILRMFWLLHKFKSLKGILSRYHFQIREHI